ncbi:MAG: hypothetical protein QNJ31_03430 [Candidatus Caenarcaniphilales bacterium]|nr:hypothetical protein [Candidatus Caenarcaniphilales bacterium]
MLFYINLCLTLTFTFFLNFAPAQSKSKIEIASELANLSLLKADLDKDNKVSRTEAESMPSMLKNFDLIDQNSDDYLVKDELQTRIASNLKSKSTRSIDRESNPNALSSEQISSSQEVIPNEAPALENEGQERKLSKSFLSKFKRSN